MIDLPYALVIEATEEPDFFDSANRVQSIEIASVTRSQFAGFQITRP